MKNFVIVVVLFVLILVSSLATYLYVTRTPNKDSLLVPFISSTDLPSEEASSQQNQETSPMPQPAIFQDTFSNSRIIEESPRIAASSDSNWWVNSGGQFIVNNGIGMTIQGELSEQSHWKELYNRTSPHDTDSGLHPQNIFRLVYRGVWLNYSQQVYTKITKINMSESPQRNESNGIFLFNRYYNGDNLYYTGIRVDGSVVIKKKYKEVYYTMAYKKIKPGKYDKISNANLLPENTWIGIKSEVKNIGDSVQINFYTDIGQTGKWTLSLSVTDNNKSYGGASLSQEGHAGIRTDFMDAQFRNYLIEEI